MSRVCEPFEYVSGRGWNTYESVRFVLSARRNALDAPGPAPVEPCRLHRIPPTSIPDRVDDEFDFLGDTGRVVEGEWDRDVSPFADGSRYGSFRDHFEDGVEWERTEFFRTTASDIRAGRNDRYAAVTEFEEACARYDRMYEDIAENGYRTQRELIESDRNRGLGNGGRGFFGVGRKAAVRHEIAVNVGRDGTFLLNDGRHRLAIARLLGIESVPVRIVVRHDEWQALRNRLYKSAIDREAGEWDREIAERILSKPDTTVEGGLEHPDLRALLPTT